MFRRVLSLHAAVALITLTTASQIALAKEFRISDQATESDSECSDGAVGDHGHPSVQAHGAYGGSASSHYPEPQLVAHLKHAANRANYSANQAARRAWNQFHTVPCRRETYAPDLFYNFHVDPNCGATATAGMYPSPHPTPAVNGRTYYTYQPLLPHETMYKHKRVYHRYYNHGMGLNRTRITYSPNHIMSVRRIMNHVLEPINYR